MLDQFRDEALTLITVLTISVLSSYIRYWQVPPIRFDIVLWNRGICWLRRQVKVADDDSEEGQDEGQVHPKETAEIHDLSRRVVRCGANRRRPQREGGREAGRGREMEGTGARESERERERERQKRKEGLTKSLMYDVGGRSRAPQPTRSICSTGHDELLLANGCYALFSLLVCSIVILDDFTRDDRLHLAMH